MVGGVTYPDQNCGNTPRFTARECCKATRRQGSERFAGPCAVRCSSRMGCFLGTSKTRGGAVGREKTSKEKECQRKFGLRVYTLRDEQGLSQDDVMAMGGLERSFISNVENDIHSISSDRLHDLAQGLRVDPVDLFEQEGDQSSGDKNATPRYLQLADYIRKEILAGLLKPGQSLMSESDLCATYGYSRFAVAKAIAVLRGQGFIRARRDGHYVASACDLEPVAIGDGDEVIARMPTEEEASHYGISDGVPVFVTTRRSAEPISIECRRSIEQTGTSCGSRRGRRGGATSHPGEIVGDSARS